MSLLKRWPDRRDAKAREKAKETAARRRETGLRLLVAVLFFGLATSIIMKKLPPERAWPVTALFVIGAVIALVPWDVWRSLLASIEQAQIGPVSLGLRHHTERAAADAPESDKGEGGDQTPTGKAKSMFELRLRLEWKLAYVAKHLLAENGSPTFFTIGSLQYDGYLTESEARTAIGILSTGDDQLRAMDRPQRDEFFEEAEKFVDSVRACIFWGQVKRRLRGGGMPAGTAALWLGDIDGKGKRDDLLAGRPGNEFWVAPAFAIDTDSSIHRAAAKRLETNERPYGVAAERRLIVIPDTSKFEPEPDERPRVVTLAELREVLEHPPGQ